MLLEHEEKYRPAFSNFGFDKLVNGIPDESYWSTLAQHHGMALHEALTTYMEDGDAKTGLRGSPTSGN